MVRLRRVLWPIAVVWLFGQAMTLSVVPVVLSSGPTNAAAAECTCSHGDHSLCPMHHRPAPGQRCVMRAAAHDAFAVLTSLLHGVGPVPPPTFVSAPPGRHVVVVLEETSTSTRPAPPTRRRPAPDTTVVS